MRFFIQKFIERVCRVENDLDTLTYTVSSVKRRTYYTFITATHNSKITQLVNIPSTGAVLGENIGAFPQIKAPSGERPKAGE